MDLQAELAMRLGAKRPALEQSMEVDEEDEAPEAEGEGEEGGTAGRGAKKEKKKKKKKRKKRSRTTSKVSQKSTGVWQVPSLRVSRSGIVYQYETASGVA